MSFHSEFVFLFDTLNIYSTITLTNMLYLKSNSLIIFGSTVDKILKPILEKHYLKVSIQLLAIR